jgi:hypothetical protein
VALFKNFISATSAPVVSLILKEADITLNMANGRGIKTTVLIEGAVLLFLSLAGIAEGLRLVIDRDPYTLYDPLGPGLYILLIGLGLMTLGIGHLVIHYRKPSIQERGPVDRKMQFRMIGTVAACAIYILLIKIAGYLPATLLFFFLELRIQGIKSWPFVILLSLVLSALSYFVFVQCCSMVFPRGIIFR